MKTARLLPRFLPLTFAILACGGNDTVSPAAEGAIARNAGDAQTATVGTALQPYQVKVTGQGTTPTAGITVHWAVVSGGGSVSAATSVTDAAGLAEITATLGTVIGPQVVRAVARGLIDSLVTFTSTGTADVPAQVLKSAGDGQQAGTSTALPVPLAVSVRDRFGNAVNQGITVAWAVTSGLGSVTAATSVTNASGVASIGMATGARAGAAVVTASVAGATSSATFAVTANWALTLLRTIPIVQNYGIHDTYVRDGIAFVFEWNTGVQIFDVGGAGQGGSMDTPILLSTLVTAGGEVHNGWWFHNPVSGQNRYLFIGQEGPGTIGNSSTGDIHVVDVSNLAAPAEVATFHLPGAGVHNFWMDEAAQRLYASYYNGGVVALDVSGTLSGALETQGRLIANVKPGGAGNTYVWGVQLYNGSLYAVDMVSGFWQLSPSNLVTLGGGNNVPERYGSDLWVAGGYGYSGTWGFRGTAGNAVKIWQLSPSGAPSLVDSLLVSQVGTISDLEVTQNGKALVLSAEGGAGNGVYVYSLADPRRPVLLARALSSQGVHTVSLAYQNGRTYAFGARDPSGAALLIYDITDMTQ